MQFSVGQILSVISNRLLVEDIGDLYIILNFMTNDDLFTHQLCRGADECRPYVIDQVDWAEEVMSRMEWDLSTVWWNQNWQEFVSSVEDKYDKYHELEHMPLEDHEVIDPIEELEQNYPDIKIIPIQIENNISPYGDINWAE